MRKVVEKFAEAMERVLQENDYKGGWDKDIIGGLLDRCKDEMWELEFEIDERSIRDIGKIQKEAVEIRLKKRVAKR